MTSEASLKEVLFKKYLVGDVFVNQQPPGFMCYAALPLCYERYTLVSAELYPQAVSPFQLDSARNPGLSPGCLLTKVLRGAGEGSHLSLA